MARGQQRGNAKRNQNLAASAYVAGNQLLGSGGYCFVKFSAGSTWKPNVSDMLP
jgi:hypothetical protein